MLLEWWDIRNLTLFISSCMYASCPWALRNEKESISVVEASYAHTMAVFLANTDCLVLVLIPVVIIFRSRLTGHNNIFYRYGYASSLLSFFLDLFSVFLCGSSVFVTPLCRKRSKNVDLGRLLPELLELFRSAISRISGDVKLLSCC